MTVSYTGDVANGSSFGCFWKILGRWRGSVYKLVWRELLAYLCLYYIINFIYRFGLDDIQKTTFEKIKVYCRKNIESIPMSFVLGFYVTLIVKRWWDQYWILPMPDSLALYVSASIQGQDERGRILRRTIMRYAILSYIIALQRICFRVKKRFPTMQHVVDAGIMTQNEMEIYEKVDKKAKVAKYWLPTVWAANLINRARHEGRITSDQMVQTVVTELSMFRRRLGRIMVFDNVSVPLVYTQVVTLAVYTYFLAALIGRQWVAPSDKKIIDEIYPGYDLDLYFPIFLSLQFVFYIGWLKVAETLINPFGEDDDDFELNWLIDRHIKVAYLVVDEMHEEHPELLKDQYWEQIVPQDLPYNIASERYRKSEPQGSTASLKVNPNESVYADLTSVKRHSAIPDDVYAEYESVVDSPLADGRKSWLQRQLSRVESFRSTSSASSLFVRNRSNSGANGGLGLGYHGHNRPSLYERLLNRRSGKHTRHSNRGIQRPNNNSLTVPEKTILPLSRPRVPTPDVDITKDNHLHPQVQITAASPPPTIRCIGSPQNGRNDELSPVVPRTGYGAPAAQHMGLYAKKNHIHMNLLQSSCTEQPISHESNDLPSTPNNATDTKDDGIPTPPPPYDQTQTSPPANAVMLSPIAENDNSPYSTSSPTQTFNLKSTSYPTTTSIFGRKPSPPPQIELPPIPTINVSSSNRSANYSLKSEHTSASRPGISDNNLFTTSSASDRRHVTDLIGRINEGYETDEEDGRRYMTIAEVKECKEELEKTLTVQPLLVQPLASEELQRNTSDDSVTHLTVLSGHPLAQELMSSSSGSSNTPIPLEELDKEPESSTSSGSAPSASIPIAPSTSSENDRNDVLINSNNGEPDEDDGYHERVSYSEDDSESNQSEKADSLSTAKNKSRKNSMTSGVNSTQSPSTKNSSMDMMPSCLLEMNRSDNLDVEDFSLLRSNGDTLKSNASDSDISHISTFSVDQSLPPPTRQKPIRRRKTDPSISKCEDANNKDLEARKKTKDATKEDEVFV